MHNIQVSINIITLGRSTLYKTLQCIYAQIFPYTYEINLILQGSIDQDHIDSLNSSNVSTHIYYYRSNLGFGYYRNQAIQKSHGEILVWIDDDERTEDTDWLNKITESIYREKYQVVTGGYFIPLGKSYSTDCISLLGYPGGGALGFEKMRTVGKNNETTHLCTGNFALHRAVFDTIGYFEESLIYGAEDVVFGDYLVQSGIKILYKKECDVFHIHRSGFITFCAWHFRRGKSVYEFTHLSKIKTHHKKDKLLSIFHVLGQAPLSYFPGVLFFFVVQYICQFVGYVHYSLLKR